MNENLSEPVRCTMKLLFLLWRRKQIYGDLCLIRNTLCHKRLVFDTLLCIVCIFPNGNIGPCSKMFKTNLHCILLGTKTFKHPRKWHLNYYGQNNSFLWLYATFSHGSLHRMCIISNINFKLYFCTVRTLTKWGQYCTNKSFAQISCHRCVLFHVPPHITRLSASIIALLASKGLLTSVGKLVSPQLACFPASETALIAWKGFFSGMLHHVSLETTSLIA